MDADVTPTKKVPIITFHVGTAQFDVAQATVKAHEVPRSLTANKEEFFLDSNPQLVPYILLWYRDGDILFREGEEEARAELRHQSERLGVSLLVERFGTEPLSDFSAK